jgi:hypothetical protein
MKKILVLISIILSLGVGFVFGAVRGRDVVEQEYAARITPIPVGFPTGYDVLDELNRYRVSQGLSEFELYKPLCNNIAARWQNYVDNDSHGGFYDFVVEYMPEGLEVSEILTSGVTAREMVQKWSSSPSHDVSLRDNSKICVYSADGYSVALLSN